MIKGFQRVTMADTVRMEFLDRRREGKGEEV